MSVCFFRIPYHAVLLGRPVVHGHASDVQSCHDRKQDLFNVYSYKYGGLYCYVDDSTLEGPKNEKNLIFFCNKAYSFQIHVKLNHQDN